MSDSFNSMISTDALISIFHHFRRKSGQLGLRELFDAVRLLEDREMTPNDAALREHLRLLWCRSQDEEAHFDALWIAAQHARQDDARSSDSTPERQTETPELSTELPSYLPAENERPATDSGWSALPIHAPQFQNDEAPAEELRAVWPVSRRQMLYGWRRLRRMQADGALTIFDLPETVERVARQGVLAAYAYRRKPRNHARLLLMIDQNGSMTPLHRFSRDLVQTAQRQAEAQELDLDVAYFHNVPGEYLYADPHLTLPVDRNKVRSRCDRETSVIIVSDAGAARGFRHLPRIQRTIEALVFLKQATRLIAWLNPMPENRWRGSSAQMLAGLVTMRSLHWEGFSQVINAARGLPLS